MPGLMRYLYGPGKADDHRDQHMVAGYGALPFVYAGALSQSQAAELGRMVELSWREQFREEQALAGGAGRGVSASALSGSSQGALLLRGTGAVDDGDVDTNFKEHVYHVVASLGPDEGPYTDEQWAEVAAGVVQGMGFSTGSEDLHGNSWVAVRHGLSAQGNDHIHIAINQVRQDGQRTRLSGDYRLAQAVRRDLEQRLNFVPPLSQLGHDRRPGGRAQLPAYTNKEAGEARDRTVQGQPVVPDRVQLQRLVRGAAGAAQTEAQFIQNVLDQGGFLQAARWSPGDRDQVTGYRVALKENTRWFTASELAPDLTLGKLRPSWQGQETDASRELALGLWREEIAPVDAAQPGAGDVEEHLAAAVGELQAWTEQLREADATDVARWRQETADAATVASVLSPPLAIPSDRADRTQPIPTSTVLGRGADALTRLSLGDRAAADGAAAAPAPASPSGPSHAELAARHLMIAMRASSPDSHRGWLAVMQQFSRTVGAIRDAHQVRGELAAAHRVHQVTLSALTDVQERLQQIDGPSTAGGAQVQETAFEDLSPAAQRVRASMLHGTPDGRLRLDPTADGGRDYDSQRPRSTGGPEQDRGRSR